MPKKFGVNTKYTLNQFYSYRKEEAKQREANKKKEEKEKMEKKVVDEFWEESDPKVIEKINKEVIDRLFIK
jgi:hypothetical protein